jgi:cell division protein FtsB
MLIGGAVLAAVILVAWFPASSLLHQRSNLASASTELSQLHQQDAALAQERKNLSDSSEIARIAREQYQLVNPGQQAFEVLPPSDASETGTPYAGDPGATGPVAPSAAAELPPASVTTTTTTAPATGTTHPGSSHSDSSAHTSADTTGFLGRMLHTLEFWR